MFQTGQSEFKSYFKVSEDGISRNMKLKSIEFITETDRVHITFEDPNGAEWRGVLFPPDLTKSEQAIAYNVGKVEEIASALVPGGNFEEKFGQSQNFETFEDYCNFFINKIDIEKAPLVDLAIVYTGNTISVEGDGKKTYPKAVFASTRPFISSPYFTRDLTKTIEKECGNPQYPKYTKITNEVNLNLATTAQVPTSVAPQAQAFEAAPKVGSEDDLPF